VTISSMADLQHNNCHVAGHCWTTTERRCNRKEHSLWCDTRAHYLWWQIVTRGPDIRLPTSLLLLLLYTVGH